MNWRREQKVMVKSLPDERKALAERYTIDSEEAERREQLAVEQAARRAAADEAAKKDAESAALREAAESGRRAAEGEAARRAAQEAATALAAAETEGQRRPESIAPAAEPQPQLVPAPVFDPPEASEIAEGDEREQTVDLPIYRWFGNG